MSAELSAENDRYLQEAVESGAYPSLAQAMNAAVELLRRRDELRREIQAGIDEANRGELLDGEEVFRELKRRAREITAEARKQQ